MKTSNNTSETTVLVNFHIGRGGRFYNQGHLTFKGVGENPKQYVESGNFLNDDKSILHDSNGNEIGDYNPGECDYHYDIDGDYDTSYGKMIQGLSDLTEEEMDAVMKDSSKWELEKALNITIETE